jgi:hypothetical protein
MRLNTLRLTITLLKALIGTISPMKKVTWTISTLKNLLPTIPPLKNLVATITLLKKLVPTMSPLKKLTRSITSFEKAHLVDSSSETPDRDDKSLEKAHPHHKPFDFRDFKRDQRYSWSDPLQRSTNETIVHRKLVKSWMICNAIGGSSPFSGIWPKPKHKRHKTSLI